jgi:hypothetical protein
MISLLDGGLRGGVSTGEKVVEEEISTLSILYFNLEFQG